jgi:hypothetical protein
MGTFGAAVPRDSVPFHSVKTLTFLVLCVLRAECIVTCMSVTVDGVWIGNRDLLDSLIQRVTTLYSTLLHIHRRTH